MDQADIASKAIANGDVVIACQQEADRFAAIAEDLGAPEPQFVDIRDRAGWSDDVQERSPKMAALIADALLLTPATKSVDIISEGRCLILGAEEIVLAAAERLADALAVTVLLEPGTDILPTHKYDAVVGDLRQATGTLGRFEIRIDAFQQSVFGGRGTPGLTQAKDGAISKCDIILD
ncbi:MAG: (4Fe-4S)-binding protein, partial [Octadecabacter sp.]